MSKGPSSSRRGALVAVVATLACACAARHPAPARSAAAFGPVAILPFENASGDQRADAFEARLEQALRERGVDVVARERVEVFLAARRIRWTGGLDVDALQAAPAELGVRGVVVGTVGLSDAGPPPRLALTLRLVDADATIEWIDGVEMTGDDAPGLLGVGRITTSAALADRAVVTLGASLARRLEGGAPAAGRCRGGARFAPKASFNSWRPRLGGRDLQLAVLPFSGVPGKRNAGRLIALEFVRQLSGTPGVRVVEPGVVRERLLASRVRVGTGLSLDTVHAAFDALGVDLLIGGDVGDFADGAYGAHVTFTASLFERGEDEVVWQARSDGSGAEVVGFFGMGRIPTAGEVACELVSGAVRTMRVTR